MKEELAYIIFESEASEEEKELFEDNENHEGIGLSSTEEGLNMIFDIDKTVISESDLSIKISYPLTNPVEFKIYSEEGFTRRILFTEIRKKYKEIYQEEQESANVKVVPPDEREILMNRNQTDGKYGIWGHDISDLILVGIEIHKNNKGEIILELNIQS